MMENSRNRYHDWMKVALALAVVSAVLIQCIGAWQDSQTTDEAVHLSAGTLYWRDRAWLLNPEHPPVVKLLAGLPLAPLAGLSLPSHVDRQTEPNQWLIGAQLLYEMPNLIGGRWLLFIGRLPMIFVWGALAWFIYRWGSKWWHPVAGLIASALFLFDPNFLGHGHLVTTDVGASLGYLAAIFFADRFFRQPTRRNLWVMAIVFGLAQTIKFSLFFLWLVIPLLGLVRHWMDARAFPGRQWWAMLGAMLLASGLIIWASYGFAVMRPADDPRVDRLWQEQAALAKNVSAQPPLIQRLVTLTDPDSTSGQAIRAFFEIPIPAYPYWRGLSAIISHSSGGHGAYLWGQASYTGWWWYFPVAIFFKTPLVILAGLAVSSWWLFRRFQKTKTIPWAAWVLGLPPLLFLLWSLTSRINIGLRHVFPIYPFIYLSLGYCAWRLWQYRHGSTIISLGLTAYAIGALAAYPNTIGYFNAAAGGTTGGHRYLLDSNLDWNQDIWRLRGWLDANRITEYQLSLFGSIPENRVFPESRPVPTTRAINLGQQPSGLVIISANRLYNPLGEYTWLQSKTPTKQIGSSIYVFDFR